VYSMARLCRALVPVGSLPCKAAVALFAASRAAAWCPGVPDLQVAGYRKRRPQVKTIDCSPDLPLRIQIVWEFSRALTVLALLAE